MPEKKNKITQVLEKIEKNEIKIHPKTYFRVRFAALLIAVFLLFLVSIFLSSFILFSLRASGRNSLIGFGQHGFMVFLLLFPWKLLALEILLIVAVEWLVRSFKFAYKIPVLYLVIGVLVIMGISGYIVAETPFHKGLLREYDDDHLPAPFKNLYEGVRHPSAPPEGRGIFHGTVVSVKDNTLVVNVDDPRKHSVAPFTVIIPEGQPMDTFAPGDKVFIEGTIVNGQIQATEIENSNELNYYPLHIIHNS